ncbi:cysteine desulfurase [Candidatus Gracilibacteria bacterium]|nr:cysteine desulfurase [Candidatus Gracilibacteria bacterium]
MIDFPFLKTGIHYLDNAATTQKPASVINAITEHYENGTANVHRGIHSLSEQATDQYEATRQAVADFINAKPEQIIFTKGTTESINIVAHSHDFTAEDEIIVSALEHHSNLVPWQQTKAKLRVIPLKEDLSLDLEAYKKLLSPNTKLVAITAMSNVLGTITPLQEIIDLAHANDTKVLVDAAQYASHFAIDMQKLKPDFLALSSHKMLGPTGVGILYTAHDLKPMQFGGDMILTVSQYESTFAPMPTKMEAGTPNIADVIAFKAALETLTKIGFDKIATHDTELLNYAIEKFSAHPEVTLYTPPNQAAVLSFNVKGSHPHDIASVFNEFKVAIRSGQHCAEPLMNTLGVPATARMSFHIYNTTADIDQAEKALEKVIKLFS